ncbi:DNA polymerase I [Butyrivibrio sp. NC3005]|uniref:DNA polymerase I n=1 Tax=Butyrivibrio sp. NC3005 TaxID=1280685 RepID=UPI000406AA7E|nr:DNA polymerase I [Butyrivibrio sp. NC3005]
MKKLLIFDGESILEKAWLLLPRATKEYSSGIYGFLYFILKEFEKNTDSDFVVCFDGEESLERKKSCKSYKKNSDFFVKELKKQRQILIDLLPKISIPLLKYSDAESIDVIRKIVSLKKNDNDVVIYSDNVILLQEKSENVVIENTSTVISEGSAWSDYLNIESKYLNAALVLTGQYFRNVEDDERCSEISSDDFLGLGTSLRLLEQYESIEGIYTNIEEISGNSIKEKLLKTKDIVLLMSNIFSEKIFLSDESNKEIDDYLQKENLSFERISINTDVIEILNENKVIFLAKKFPGLFENVSLEKDNFAEDSCGEFINADENPFDGIVVSDDVKESFEEADNDEILTRIDLSNVPYEKHLVCGINEAEEIFNKALEKGKNKDTFVGYMLLEDSKNTEDFMGLSLCFDERKAYFIKKDDSMSLEYFRKKLELLSKECRLSTFDIKNTYHFFTPYEIDNEKEEGNFDILLGAYLINPLKNDYTISDIALEYLNLSVKSYEEYFGKTKLKDFFEIPVQMTFDFLLETPKEDEKPKRKKKKEDKIELDPEKALERMTEYSCDNARVFYEAARALEKSLKAINELNLMRKIEMPLTYVLYDMEKEGIICKKEALKEYGDSLKHGILSLEKDIYEEVGKEFNINSPKQLGTILFEDMNIPGGKKTKTGYSTSAEVLESLAGDYPFVKKILEYRTLTKLKSTYADSLADYIGKDNRIHTKFNQTITATGRISSSDPNLQNIPMRTELGRAIRKVFVPRDGYVFADADYSQVELRILADISKDEGLIEDYKSGKDIHRSTASRVFHTPFEEVTDLQRSNAKAVNFGIVYGISSFGLAADLGISRTEASGYMDEYFKMYPKVKEYQKKAIEFAREKGYSVTMFDRRRPIPEITDSNHNKRQFGERVAMNAPIQGTAADIMKIAMINVYKELRTRNMKSKLILQIHDELLIETAKDEVDKVKEILTAQMQNAAHMAVPLIAECNIGEDFFKAKG